MRVTPLTFCLLLAACCVAGLPPAQAAADIGTAEALRDAGDHARAYTAYSELAEGGNALAQYNLGRLFQQGHGVEKSLPEAFKWFALANEGGYRLALYEQGKVRAQMSAAELARGQALTYEWLVLHGADKPAGTPGGPPFRVVPVTLPSELHRSQAYPGAERSEAEVATLFVSDGQPRWESVYVCEVDGQPAERLLGPGRQCASVVYLLPGKHELTWQYVWQGRQGRNKFTVAVEAGKLYQLNVSSLGRPDLIVRMLPAVAPLVYRSIGPFLTTRENADLAVPYGKN